MISASSGPSNREKHALASTSRTDVDDKASKSQSVTGTGHPMTSQAKIGDPLRNAAAELGTKKAGKQSADTPNRIENVVTVPNPPSLPSWTARGYKVRNETAVRLQRAHHRSIAGFPGRKCGP